MQPTLTEIVTAFRNKQFSIDDIEKADLIYGKNGFLEAYTGNFAVTFPLVINKKKIAVKCWHRDIGDLEDRYSNLTRKLESNKLINPYFTKFKYIENGIRINGQYYPILISDWIEGESFKSYLKRNHQSLKEIISIKEKFRLMVKTLYLAGISHGDLALENIIINNKSQIKLIDYDSVLDFTSQPKKEYISGRLEYQHPKRINLLHSSPKADFFSELIIYLGLTALTKRSSIWDEFKVFDSNSFLFEKHDFLNLKESKPYLSLKKLNDKEIEILLKILEIFCQIDDINNLFSLDFGLEFFNNAWIKDNLSLFRNQPLNEKKIKKINYKEIEIRKAKCRELIRDVKINECLKELKLVYENSDNEIISHLIMIEHRWKKHVNEKFIGIYSRDELDMDERKIIYNILTLLEKY